MADLDDGRRHEVPWRHSPLSSSWSTRRPAVRMASMWRTMPLRASASITPTSTEGVGIAHAEFAHGAAQHRQHMVGAVFLDAQHAQRRAALASRIEGRAEHVEHDLLGQRRRIHHHRVLAAGLGDQRNGVAVVVQAIGQRAGDDARHVGRAGEHDAAHARAGHQLRADGLATAGQQLHGASRHAGGAQDLDGLGRDQRRLFGGLGQHGIAGRQRGGDLAGEDGQREVPGADAQHGAHGRCVSLPNSRDA